MSLREINFGGKSIVPWSCFVFCIPDDLVTLNFVLRFNEFFRRFHHATKNDTSENVAVIELDVMNKRSAIIVQSDVFGRFEPGYFFRHWGNQAFEHCIDQDRFYCLHRCRALVLKVVGVARAQIWSQRRLEKDLLIPRLLRLVWRLLLALLRSQSYEAETKRESIDLTMCCRLPTIFEREFGYNQSFYGIKHQKPVLPTCYKIFKSWQHFYLMAISQRTILSYN